MHRVLILLLIAIELLLLLLLLIGIGKQLLQVFLHTRVHIFQIETSLWRETDMCNMLKVCRQADIYLVQFLLLTFCYTFGQHRKIHII